MIIKAIQIEVSCVAQSTEQFFSLEILHRRSKTFCEFSASRLPVGSSAIKSSGLQITALAIATLCFWPPDILATLFFLISVISNAFNQEHQNSRKTRSSTHPLPNQKDKQKMHEAPITKNTRYN